MSKQTQKNGLVRLFCLLFSTEERVRNGLAAAKARGAKIGRVRKRNSALIESLLEAGMSFRSIAAISKCSHGSVSAQKKEWLARKAAEAKAQANVFETNPALPQPSPKLIGEPSEDGNLPEFQHTATPPRDVGPDS